MKYAAGIIGIIGAIGALVLGAKWLSDIGDAGELASVLPTSMKAATYALLACGIVGLIFSILILMLKFNRWVNGALLVVCGLLPVILLSDALFGLPMVLGGLLAFAVKYEKAAAAGQPPLGPSAG